MGKNKKKKYKDEKERENTAVPSVPITEPRKLPTRERCLDSGVIVRDSVIGMGPIAKPGRRLSISYISNLLSDGTIFDENIGDSEVGKGKGGNGGPLTFRTGLGGGH